MTSRHYPLILTLLCGILLVTCQKQHEPETMQIQTPLEVSTPLDIVRASAPSTTQYPVPAFMLDERPYRDTTTPLDVLVQNPSTLNILTVIYRHINGKDPRALDALAKFDPALVNPILIEFLDKYHFHDVIDEVARRQIAAAEPRIIPHLLGYQGAINFPALKALKEIRKSKTFWEMPEVQKIFSGELGTEISRYELADNLYGPVLREIYCGEKNVGCDGGCRYANRGIKSAGSILILKQWDGAQPIANSRAKDPSTKWESDLNAYPGLASTILPLLKNGSAWTEWKTTTVRELWLIRNQPTTVGLTVSIEREPNTPEELSYYSMTMIAVQKPKQWVIIPAVAGFSGDFGSSTNSAIWDIVDADEDGQADVLINTYGYESESLSIFSIQPDDTYKLIGAVSGWGC